MADITPAHKLFDLLVSRDFDPEMLDATGRPAESPGETEIFSFDFRAESGRDYGTVVIMLGDDTELEVYCSDNVGRSMEGDVYLSHGLARKTSAGMLEQQKADS